MVTFPAIDALPIASGRGIGPHKCHGSRTWRGQVLHGSCLGLIRRSRRTRSIVGTHTVGIARSGCDLRIKVTSCIGAREPAQSIVAVFTYLSLHFESVFISGGVHPNQA